MQKFFYLILLQTLFITIFIPIATATENKETSTNTTENTLFAYTVSFDSPKQLNLEKLMESYSQLIQLKSQTPDSRINLELRIKEDMAIGKKLLLSEGYYDGRIEQHINWEKKPIAIQLLFIPNVQYTIGKTTIYYEGAHTQTLPQTLSFFNIHPGSPVIAKDILNAVDSSITYLQNNGYPLAKLQKTEYIIDRIEQTINVNVYIHQGNLMYMGNVNLQGNSQVSAEFLNKIIPWKIGRLWNNAYLSTYENRLQQTGLFSSITLTPEKNLNKDGTTPIRLAVIDAPPKTISAGIIYSTDEGPGFRGSWVHRNILGNGENLNITAPISKDNKQLLAIFRKPAFGSPRQTLISETELTHENIRAYDQKFFSSAIGLERQINKQWSATTKLSFFTGVMDDKISSKDHFIYFGTPIALKRDTTNDPLDPKKGTKLTLATTPYVGKYKKRFTTLRSRATFSTYFTPTKKITLAGKISIGALIGKDVTMFPATLRFYTGGGGSVRGYDYLSIGPQNSRGVPLGGLSSLTVSLELRLKLTENIGIVPFIDGGNVYEQQLPNLGKRLFWGLGIGFRYYSSIAPIRIDIATPLENRKNNKTIQFYISIGQAF